MLPLSFNNSVNFYSAGIPYSWRLYIILFTKHIQNIMLKIII